MQCNAISYFRPFQVTSIKYYPISISRFDASFLFILTRYIYYCCKNHYSINWNKNNNEKKEWFKREEKWKNLNSKQHLKFKILYAYFVKFLLLNYFFTI